jgi:hypothetical protein
MNSQDAVTFIAELATTIDDEVRRDIRIMGAALVLFGPAARLLIVVGVPVVALQALTSFRADRAATTAKIEPTDSAKILREARSLRRFYSGLRITFLLALLCGFVLLPGSVPAARPLLSLLGEVLGRLATPQLQKADPRRRVSDRRCRAERPSRAFGSSQMNRTPPSGFDP